MVLYFLYDKLHIINICTTYSLWNVHNFFSFAYKDNLTYIWYTIFNTFHLHFMSGMLESSYSEKRN